LQEQYNNAYDAKNYLERYEKNKEKILELPLKEKQKTYLEYLLQEREKLVAKVNLIVENRVDTNARQIKLLEDKIITHLSHLNPSKF